MNFISNLYYIYLYLIVIMRYKLQEWISNGGIIIESYQQPIIRLADVSDAKKLKDINDLFNDEDDTTFNELETSLRKNKDEIIICADIGSAHLNTGGHYFI